MIFAANWHRVMALQQIMKKITQPIKAYVDAYLSTCISVSYDWPTTGNQLLLEQSAGSMACTKHGLYQVQLVLSMA